MKTKFKLWMGLKIVVGITFFVLLFGFGTMHLWNWLVPMLFHGPIITFYQAIGLLILSKILFGGFGKGGWRGRHGHCGGRNSHWKERMKERFENMTPEQKERFKNKCGSWYDMKDSCEDAPVIKTELEK